MENALGYPRFAVRKTKGLLLSCVTHWKEGERLDTFSALCSPRVIATKVYIGA